MLSKVSRFSCVTIFTAIGEANNRNLIVRSSCIPWLTTKGSSLLDLVSVQPSPKHLFGKECRSTICCVSSCKALSWNRYVSFESENNQLHGNDNNCLPLSCLIRTAVEFPILATKSRSLTITERMTEQPLELGSDKLRLSRVCISLLLDDPRSYG